MAGRYYERKKELDALYRDKKTSVYDEFLTNLFKQIHYPNPSLGPNQGFVDYLREYYRKMILWTGPIGTKSVFGMAQIACHSTKFSTSRNENGAVFLSCAI